MASGDFGDSPVDVLDKKNRVVKQVSGLEASEMLANGEARWISKGQIQEDEGDGSFRGPSCSVSGKSVNERFSYQERLALFNPVELATIGLISTRIRRSVTV